MPALPLSTADLAAAVGCHPNTVRLYEAWGFLPPIPRAANGYRQFTQQHLDQLHLARLALCGPYPGGKQTVLDLVARGAAGDLGGALEHAYRYLMQIRAEHAHAETAAMLVERWVNGAVVDARREPLTIKRAAQYVGVHAETLRGWERNGLLAVPRHPDNGYRLYGAAEIGRIRIIRLLRNVGYSVMAILRLMHHIDQQGEPPDVRHLLDTPGSQEEVLSASARYLSMLAAQEQRALDIIELVETRLSQR